MQDFVEQKGGEWSLYASSLGNGDYVMDKRFTSSVTVSIQ